MHADTGEYIFLIFFFKERLNLQWGGNKDKLFAFLVRIWAWVTLGWSTHLRLLRQKDKLFCLPCKVVCVLADITAAMFDRREGDGRCLQKGMCSQNNHGWWATLTLHAPFSPS